MLLVYWSRCCHFYDKPTQQVFTFLQVDASGKMARPWSSAFRSCRRPENKPQPKVSLVSGCGSQFLGLFVGFLAGRFDLCCNSWIGMIFLIEASHIWPPCRPQVFAPPSPPASSKWGCWVGAKKGMKEQTTRTFRRWVIFLSLFKYNTCTIYVKIWKNTSYGATHCR